jgi:hypothetical protein
MLRSWRDAPLDGRLGGSVLAVGVALCTVGTLLEPRARASVEYAWWAQLLQIVFWAGACGAAAGVLRRRRVALVGAIASAASFATAAALVPYATTAGMTVAWLGELACAATFAVVVVRAAVVSRPARAPAEVPAQRRALV